MLNWSYRIRILCMIMVLAWPMRRFLTQMPSVFSTNWFVRWKNGKQERFLSSYWLPVSWIVFQLKVLWKSKAFGAKLPVLCANNTFYLVQIGRLRHVSWAVKACWLPLCSIWITELGDDFKALNTWKSPRHHLFHDFILSRKTNQFNKRKVY